MPTANIYDFADTWNGAGDFDLIKGVVTNTLSGSGSNLLNLSIAGGASIVGSKGGVLTLNDGSNSLAISPVVATTRTNLGLGTIATQAASAVAITGGTIAGATFNNGVIGGSTPAAGTFTNVHAQQFVADSGSQNIYGKTHQVGTAGSVQFSDGAAYSAIVLLDSSGVLCVGNGTTNAGGLQVANTRTSTTINELWRSEWSSNVCYTGVKAGSGGGAKRLEVSDGAAETALTDNTATAFVQIAVASGAAVGGSIDYAIFATDGTDHQISSGIVNFSAVNKAGTETGTVGTVVNEAKALSAGTLTHAFDIDTSPSNAVNIRVTADTSLTTSTFVIRYRVNILGPSVTVTPQ